MCVCVWKLCNNSPEICTLFFMFNRGSPHVHCLLWDFDAPSRDTATDKDICTYIDGYCTSVVPHDDPELKELVLSRQQHKCNKICKQKGQVCRFGFPRPPTDETLISLKCTSSSQSDGMDTDKQLSQVQHAKIRKEILANMWSVVDSDTDISNISFQELLTLANITRSQYIDALGHSTASDAVILKRNTDSLRINNYNKDILKYWKGNIDVQYILDAYACIMYICSYITKSERKMSDVLRAVSKEAHHKTVKEKLNIVKRTFLKNREMSAQEAAYHLVPLPLKKFSRQVIFVSANHPTKRVSLLKTKEQLEDLEDDDTDIYMSNTIQRYSARPSCVEQMCLAEFAISYKTAPTSSKNATDFSTSDKLPKTIVLNKDMGTMVHREKVAVLRTFIPSANREPEDHYYGKLLLFFPWQDESVDLVGTPTYLDKYKAVQDIICANERIVQPQAVLVDAAIDSYENIPEMQDIWPQFNSNMQQEELQDQVTSAAENPEHLLLDPTTLSSDNIDSMQSTTPFIPVPPMSYSEYRSHMRTLNEMQYKIYLDIFQWAQSIKFKQDSVHPLHLFVSGGAGFGKSHLIKALDHMLNMTLRNHGDAPDDTVVLLTAPTGILINLCLAHVA